MSTRDENAVRIGAAAAVRSVWNSLPNQVLLLLCLMYMLFYADRVNISIAAPLIQQYPLDGRPAIGGSVSAPLLAVWEAHHGRPAAE